MARFRRSLGALLAAFSSCLSANGAGRDVDRRGPPPLAVPRPAVARAIFVRGGTFARGREGDRPDEGPRHEIILSDFYLDATLVTRAHFEMFTEQTGYRTTAEQIGFGMGASEGMGDWEWERIPGATFRRPFWEFTEDHRAFLRDDAPVVMVSYVDARAYCAHLGQRLPTEAEWEYAMRAGQPDARYPWGDGPVSRDGRPRLNFWQGATHAHNDRLDGWVYVSPVEAFPPNAWGFHDPVGNAWQWTADWYSPVAYEAYAGGRVVTDPGGPPSGSKRVLRGGSWWCGECTCEGYGLHYRGKAEPGAPFNNVSFRCAR